MSACSPERGVLLLKADISQFYPALYTHAVGWAIDDSLRQRKNWNNRKLVGKQIDQALMNMQGKVSQGVPIGPDASFLLAEAVLSQVDHALKVRRRTAYRWYDDYEIGCDSRQEAEQVLARLRAELAKFGLRLNGRKTSIEPLPVVTSEEWQSGGYPLWAQRDTHAASFTSAT